jgi:hypothetical protein
MKAQRLCQCPMDHPFFNRWLPAGGHDSKLSGSWFSFCNGNKTWFQLHERWLGPPMSLSSIPREQYCEAESSRASRSNSGFVPSFGCFQRRKRKLFLLSTFFLVSAKRFSILLPLEVGYEDLPLHSEGKMEKVLPASVNPGSRTVRIHAH